MIPPENKQTKLFSFKWDIPPDTWRKARIVPGAHCGIPVGTEVRGGSHDLGYGDAALLDRANFTGFVLGRIEANFCK